MKIVCIGPGAMGCLFAAKLKRAGNEVGLMDYKEDRARLLSTNGIYVEGVTGSFHEMVPVQTRPDFHPIDLVLVCVKAIKTEEVAYALANKIGEKSIVVSLQNGVGNIEILSRFLGTERVVGGITSEGATLLGPGHVRHAGQGQTFIGAVDAQHPALPQIASLFNNAGFSTKISDNINGLIWGKLLVNAGINALAAITRLRNGVLPDLPETRDLMHEAVREAKLIAQAKGIELPYDDPIARVTEVCRATATNVASMLQDVLNRKPTEVDFINGAIAREGEALGIPTPVNRALTKIIKVIERTYDKVLA
ncbi:MAG: 2-dehydropantoate 2-reductase [Deltaproteobacteria bacterium]|nr:MAG: 2-dehydropantoate 2-reductase [Deltaproteobacteria bacterium]